MTKEKIKKNETSKIDYFTAWAMGVFMAIIAITLIAFTHNVTADEIVHKFKNPSFSGVNTSSHYLTIENQEFNRKEALEAEIEALKEAAEREANNTTLARFYRNLESRLFAQLSRQLIDNLFGENPQTEGLLELLGNIIEYWIEDGIITLKITDEDGNVTTISLPVGDFTF
tara:strand:- start:10 stop:522 length:513 start_codon:yes stop_codon:yes gene_type:complete